MKQVVVIGLLVLLAGCQSVYQGDVNSPYYVVPSGSKLVLNRALEIPPERVAVYLQDGKAYGGQPNTYQPYCKFEVRDKKTTGQRITPGTFVIHNSTRHWNYSMVGGRSGLRTVAFFGGNVHGGPTFKIYGSYFYLRSAKQPQVMKMTCEYWTVPHTGHFLTVNQIRRALGDIFTLKLKHSSSA